MDELLFEDGAVSGIRGRDRMGRSVTATARVVIGADGRHSTVAKAVRPEQYHEKPSFQAAHFAYWSGLPVDGLEIHIRPGRGCAAIPTHDDLTVLIVAWPYAEFRAHRGDIEGNYLGALELVPELAEQVRDARRETRFAGATVPAYFRKPYGPGWALVGDAGYDKDPMTAWGISDAFRDAELCSAALDEWLVGSRSFESGLAGYQQLRDEQSLPMFELTCELATLEPPPPPMAELLAAVHGDQAGMDSFVSAMAGTLPLSEFFAPPVSVAAGDLGAG